MDERKKLVEVRDRGSACDRPRHRDPGVHERDVGQGLRRAHAARRGRGRRHLLPPDAADGGARRRRRAALLPVRRRPHRHRARDVQLAVVGLRAHARGIGARSPTQIPAVCATKEGTMEHWRERRAARARARARDLGVRLHRVRGRLAAAGHRRRPRSSAPRLPPRDPGRNRSSPTYWNLVWEGRIAEAIAYSRESPASTRSATESALVSRATPDGPTTSPTGVRRSVLGRGHRPADGRLPALPAAAGHPARPGQGRDPRPRTRASASPRSSSKPEPRKFSPGKSAPVASRLDVSTVVDDPRRNRRP